MTFCVLRDLALAEGKCYKYRLQLSFSCPKICRKTGVQFFINMHTQFVWIQMFTAREVIEKHL